ncbi:hypothetical protein RFI_12274, partial [Reticulomyxa filosa]
MSSFIALVLAFFISFVVNSAHNCEVPTTNDKVLFLSDVYNPDYGSVLTSLNYGYDVVTRTEWMSYSTKQFAVYSAIVFCDMNSRSTSILNAAVNSSSVWSKAITGNIIVIGSDEASHRQGSALLKSALSFVLSDRCNTGLYVSLSEFYENAVPQKVELLKHFGTFKSYFPSGNCYDDIHIVSEHPALRNLTDGDLSNWGCSVHEVFSIYPSDFYPLAIAANIIGEYGTLYFSDGSYGIPYILVQGDAIAPVSCTHNKTRTCDDNDQRCRYTYYQIEVSQREGSVFGGDAIYITGPCFDSISRWQCQFGAVTVNMTTLNVSVGLCVSPPSNVSGVVPFAILRLNQYYQGLVLTTFYYQSPFQEDKYEVQLIFNSSWKDSQSNMEFVSVDNTDVRIEWNTTQIQDNYVDIVLYETSQNESGSFLLLLGVIARHTRNTGVFTGSFKATLFNGSDSSFSLQLQKYKYTSLVVVIYRSDDDDTRRALLFLGLAHNIRHRFFSK